jgi:hypothetical protein
MRHETAPTYTATIYMAGDIEQAKQVCRQFCCAVGLCVTIEPTTYIYTGGEERGFRVGLLNYPRFPAEPALILDRARELARNLLDVLCQHSYSIVTSAETEWFSRREAA